MKKQLIFQDAKSHKFWHIEVAGDSHTVSYGRVGTQGQRKTKTFDSTEACLKDAEKLINAKLKKGYVDEGEGAEPAPTPAAHGLAALDVDGLLSGFDWGDITDGHRDCPELLEKLQDADAQTIAHVIDTTLQAFSFVSGGGWMPGWMEKLGGKRRHGSGLLFLSNALDLLRERDESLWVTWATRALSYVVCEGEAIDHDEGEAWDIYIDISEALEPHYIDAGKGFPVEETLASIARQLSAIGTAHVRGDPLQTSVALLQSGITKKAKLKLLDHLVMFIDTDLGKIDWAIDCDGLSPELCAMYADTLEKTDVAGDLAARLIVQVLRTTGEEGEFKNGRPTGANGSDFYWPAISSEQNDRCPIFHFDGEHVRDLGTFSLVPKVMRWTPEGLYFAIKENIYRYRPEGETWTHEYDAGFVITALAWIDDRLCAVGGDPRLLIRDAGAWREIDLNSRANFSGLAPGADGAIWVTGTQGSIRRIDADGGVDTVAPMEKEKKNYRVLTTAQGVYIYCTTGLYRIDVDKPKRIVKKKVRDALASGDTIYVATTEALLHIEKDKIVRSLALDVQFLGALEEDLVACIGDKLLVLREDGGRLIAPHGEPSKPVELPA